MADKSTSTPPQPQQPQVQDIREYNFRQIFGELFDNAIIPLPKEVDYKFLENIARNLLLRSQGLYRAHRELTTKILRMLSKEPTPIGTFAVHLDPNTGEPQIIWDTRFFHLASKHLLPTVAYMLAYMRFLGKVLPQLWFKYYQQTQQTQQPPQPPQYIAYFQALANNDNRFQVVRNAFASARNENKAISETIDNFMLVMRDITNEQTEWIPPNIRELLSEAFNIHLIDPTKGGAVEVLRNLQNALQELGLDVDIVSHLLHPAQHTLEFFTTDSIARARAPIELQYTAAASIYHEWAHYAYGHLGAEGERCKQIMLNAAARRIQELAQEKGDWVFVVKDEEGKPQQTIAFRGTDSQDVIRTNLERLMALSPPFQEMFHSEFNCAVDCLVNSHVLLWLSYGATTTNSGMVPLFYFANMIHPITIGKLPKNTVDEYAEYYGRRYAEEIFGKQEPPPPPPNGGDGHGNGRWRRDARKRKFAGGDIKPPQQPPQQPSQQPPQQPPQQTPQQEEGEKDDRKHIEDIAKDAGRARSYGKTSPWAHFFEDLGVTSREREIPPLQMPWHEVAKQLLTQALSETTPSRKEPPGERGGRIYTRPIISRSGESEVYRQQHESRVLPIIVLLTDTSGSMAPIFEDVTLEVLNALRAFARESIYSGNVWNIGEQFAHPLVIIGGIDDVLRLSLMQWREVPNEQWLKKVGNILGSVRASSGTDILGSYALPLLFDLLSGDVAAVQHLIQDIIQRGMNLTEEQKAHLKALTQHIHQFASQAHEIPLFVVVATDGYTPGIMNQDVATVSQTWNALQRLLQNMPKISRVTLLFVLYPASEGDSAKQEFQTMSSNLLGSIQEAEVGSVSIWGAVSGTLQGKRYIVNGKEVQVITLLAEKRRSVNATQAQLMKDEIVVAPPAPDTQPTTPTTPPEPTPTKEEEEQPAEEEKPAESAPTAPAQQETETEETTQEEPAEGAPTPPEPTTPTEQEDEERKREKEEIKKLFWRALRKGMLGK